MNWKRIEPQENLVNQENLDDIVLNIVDDEVMQEGIGNLFSLGVLAFLLGSSGIVNAGQFKQEIGRKIAKGDKQVQQVGKAVSITKKDIADAVEKSKIEDPRIGKWRKSQILNIVARTLYMEARGEGATGLDMVMTVIWNRSGGDAAKFADECLKYKQFSCWNDKTNKTPSSYKVEFPRGSFKQGSADANSWGYCVHLAKLAIDGKFTPVNDKWNSYYNPDKANPDWGSQLLNAKMVGRHKVGELEWITNSVNRAKNKASAKTKAQVAKTKEYKVKDKDTLWAIAGKNMKNVQRIKELNNLKSDTIRPGQTLKVPV